MGSHTRADRTRDNLSITHTQTDAPLLPVAQIERLNSFAPERVDWLFTQTEEEARIRRERVSFIDTITAIERLGGLLFAFFAVSGSIYAAYRLGVAGYTDVAMVVGGMPTIAAIAFAAKFFVKRQ